jgi:metal-sulfur cluster biosynthetic enzyme
MPGWTAARNSARSCSRFRDERPQDGGATESPGLACAQQRVVYTRCMVTRDDVVEALHSVEDPELGMDIVELGLFYDAEIDGPRVKIIHSLTSMGCPAGPMIQEGMHDAVAALPGVEEVEVELTFDPPWTPDRMSDDAKFILGFG